VKTTNSELRVVSDDGEPVKQGVLVLQLKTETVNSELRVVSADDTLSSKVFWFMTEGETTNNEIGFRSWVIHGAASGCRDGVGRLVAQGLICEAMGECSRLHAKQCWTLNVYFVVEGQVSQN
jgi:hypothetical protein